MRLTVHIHVWKIFSYGFFLKKVFEKNPVLYIYYV